MEVQMGTRPKMADRQRILALLELGWSYRRIQQGRRVSTSTPQPAVRPSTDRKTGQPAPQREPYRGYMEKKLTGGLAAHRIWQDLRMKLGLSHEYATAKCLVLGPRSFFPADP